VTSDERYFRIQQCLSIPPVIKIQQRTCTAYGEVQWKCAVSGRMIFGQTHFYRNKQPTVFVRRGQLQCAVSSGESCLMKCVVDEHDHLTYLALKVKSLDLIFRIFRQYT